MPDEKFSARPFDRSDKRIIVDGPNGFEMFVDYDDVDQAMTKKTLEKMLAILNKRWRDD